MTRKKQQKTSEEVMEFVGAIDTEMFVIRAPESVMVAIIITGEGAVACTPHAAIVVSSAVVRDWMQRHGYATEDVRIDPVTPSEN